MTKLKECERLMRTHGYIIAEVSPYAFPGEFLCRSDQFVMEVICPAEQIDWIRQTAELGSISTPRNDAFYYRCVLRSIPRDLTAREIKLLARAVPLSQED